MFATRLLIKSFLVLVLFTPSMSFAATYYIDLSCTTPGNGTTATCSGANAAYAQIDSFTEVARSAGDIAFVRRTATTTSVGNDLNFTSDGTIRNPIIISADYDNIWGDFATSSQTYTVAIATSTFTASANITGIAAGDWVYVAGDCFENPNTTFLNQCEFAYEVFSVSGANLTLYLPYKGNQSGSGLSLRVMPDNPQWNIATGDFQWNFDTDDYWLVKGMDIRGTDANGQVEIDSSIAHIFIDDIFTGNGNSDRGIGLTDDASYFEVFKSRFFNNGGSIHGGLAVDVFATIKVYDSLLDQNGSATSVGIGQTTTVNGKANVYVFNSVIRNSAGSDIFVNNRGSTAYLDNTLLRSSTEFNSANADSLYFITVNNHDGTIGNNFQLGISPGTTNASFLLSTSTLRSGGGPTAIEVRPTTNTTSIWDFNKIKLFEYPIYTDTSSKQYDVYFMSTSTSEWTNDPVVSATTTEAWIECEYWAHDTGATSTRKIKKSTGTLDFNGSTAWQALSVTCQPSQAGILYLRGWYAKTKEGGAKNNQFYVDTTPVIQ